MKPTILLLLFALILTACDNTTEVVEGTFEATILPEPKLIESIDQLVFLSKESKLYTSQPEVIPLLDLFITEIKKTMEVELATTSINNKNADIRFEIDADMDEEASIIEINQKISVVGGSYTALAHAKTTLLQLLQKEGDRLKLPLVTIRDAPDAAYRGLMIDLARRWHDVSTIKKLIDLAAYYKINYVQLHFTDYQSYTLPSRVYPNLSTPERHYSFEELEELEAYSQLRGVTIVPEIDVPGHSSPFVKKYPEIFAIQDTINNPWIINMGKEEVYTALDQLIGEVLAVFKASPYFHIGGDEAIFTSVEKDPSVQAYTAKNEIGTDVHELYRHFLVRLNEIVKSHDKQMCVWEGFRPEGDIEIPKDIIVFEFETNRYLPNELIRDGYTVVNTSWKPLYVVNQKKWEPKTIYAWNMWKWDNWFDKAPSYNPIQIEKSPLVVGAQMCAWEQTQEVEIPSLRKRLPAFVERVWNTEEKIPYEALIERIHKLDQRLSLLIEDERQDDLLFDHNFKKEDLVQK